MRKLIAVFVMLMLASAAFAQTEIVGSKESVYELGVVFPLRSNAVKDFIAAHNVGVLPMTSGVGSGCQAGKHWVVSSEATVGVVCGFNMFIGSGNGGTNHIYELESLVVGRLYFGESWRGGLYAELGSGPQVTIAKFPGESLLYQVNITTQVGVGYNYRFSGDVTIGAGIKTTPSLSITNMLDGTKVVVSMLW